MSVTKTRPSGLSAMNRTRLSPSAATLTANPSGRFRKKDLPPEREMRLGTSLKAPVFDGAARLGAALRWAVMLYAERRIAANARSIRRPCGMHGPFKKGVRERRTDFTKDGSSFYRELKKPASDNVPTFILGC